MGLIVAAPTAGSSGVVPGVLLAMQDEHGLSDEKLYQGLLNASAIGYLLMRNATVSGAEAGCQAEVGAASAMSGKRHCRDDGRNSPYVSDRCKPCAFQSAWACL